MNKKVIISGVSGQAGSYFVDYLLENTDYEIYGMVRRLSVKNHKNISHIKNPRFHLFSGDLNDQNSIFECIQDIKPDYFINCAAQSFVFESWVTPANTFQVCATSIIYILEAIRKIKPECRMINFGSSEEMGDVVYSPQDEKHPPRARSVYGAAKVAARQIIKVYRESYGLHALQCWNFNYESPRRGIEFITSKVTHGVANIYHAIKNNQNFDPIELGNLNSKRDWSHAKDVIDGVWRMINQDKYRTDWQQKREDAEYHGDNDLIDFDVNKDIKEYVFSSGETHEIRELVELAFFEAGIKGQWKNGNVPENETFETADGKILVKINPKFYRPAEVDLLLGDSSLARKELGWTPKIKFNELIKEMVQSHIKEHE